MGGSADSGGERSHGVGCQLQGFPAELEFGAPGPEEPWAWYLRRRALGVRLRVRRERARLARLLWPLGWSAPGTSRGPLPAPDLAEGDRVRVRPLDYIRGTLDGMGALKGCGFGLGQRKFCGGEYRVLRRVDRFYDEARGRLLKGHHLVLLEGVQCDGSNVPWTEGCQRMCFFFWRTEWLEKLDGAASGPGALRV